MKFATLRVFVFLTILMLVELRRGFMDDILKLVFSSCSAEAEAAIEEGFSSYFPDIISQKSLSREMKEEECKVKSDQAIFLIEVLSNCGVKIAHDIADAVKEAYKLLGYHEKETEKKKKFFVDDESGKKFECKAGNTLDYANEVVKVDSEDENIIKKDALCQKSKEEAKLVLKEIENFQTGYEEIKNDSETKKNEYLASLQQFIDKCTSFEFLVDTHLLNYKDASQVLVDLHSHFKTASEVTCNKNVKFTSDIVTYLKKGYAAFKFLFYCFTEATDIIKQGIKELVKFLLDFVSAGVFKTLGIVVIMIKIVYYLYKHSISNTSNSNKMKYKGKIVGSLIRVFLELINFPGLISPIWKPSDSESESSEASSVRSTLINRESVGFDLDFIKKLRRNKSAIRHRK